MKFGFIAKHRSVWPVAWPCEALGVSRSGFHAWLHRGPSARTIVDEELTTKVRASFIASVAVAWRGQFTRFQFTLLQMIPPSTQPEVVSVAPESDILPV